MGVEHGETAEGRSAFPTSNELAHARTRLSTHRTFMADARSHMANERTHLSYLRTSLSLMSFGITLNRFSLYFRESKMGPVKVPSLLHQTETIGIGIVALGVTILCWALYRYRQVNSAIQQDNYKSPSMALTILSAGILLLGGATTLWMMLDWD